MRQLSIVLLVLLSGCQAMTDPAATNPGNSWRSITSIELKQPLAVYPGFSRAFIQDGELRHERDIDQRRVWCQFSLYEKPSALETERSIEADRFSVQGTSRKRGFAAAPGFGFGMQISTSRVSLGLFEPGRSSRELANQFEIASDRQPRVVEFKCMVFDDPAVDRFPTLPQMRKAVAGLIEFRI